MSDATPRFQDAASLGADQYRTDVNLTTRIALHQRFGTNPIPWTASLFDRLDLRGDARVLELGCGRGDLWVENRAHLPGRWNLLLSDLSAGMIAVARRRFSAAGLGATSCPGDAESLPVGDDDGWAPVRRQVEDAIATEGAFEVTKAAGLFVAS
ncbi:MAG: class I SAM-dependent methyltransferase [Chloroflexota bacterium]|nr:class I SAM-dependent methyltransferase [Chloroflexota bacterium]